jgi:hypothetical protein
VHADPPDPGEEFAYWDGDTQILNRPRTQAANEAFIIERDVPIAAIYTALPSFVVTVTHGSGDGNYYTGDTVEIAADAIGNQQFAGWLETPSSLTHHLRRRRSQCQPPTSPSRPPTRRQNILLR